MKPGAGAVRETHVGSPEAGEEVIGTFFAAPDRCIRHPITAFWVSW
jgi:hypothetical protein